MMEMSVQPLKYEERKYTYAQSQQLRSQTGSIGRLRGDFDSTGYGFYTTWEDHRRDLKTPEFKDELDEVINKLRSEEYGLLANRSAMSQFTRQYPDSIMKGNYTAEYGFRVDTEKHSYLLRCNPAKGDYNFYVYCYVRKWLDDHIIKARQDIRFINPHYKEQFRIPDGETIRMISEDGTEKERACRFIDETHVEVGNNLFHICEFAERMEQNHCHCEPKEEPLPPYCFSLLPSTGEVIKIIRYESGYIPMRARPMGQDPKHDAQELNDAIGVTKSQAAAMTAGSMFGWDCPAAHPKNYDKNGKAIRHKEQER